MAVGTLFYVAFLMLKIASMMLRLIIGSITIFHINDCYKNLNS
ncbi:hypothetical protein JCM19232_5439 [Vibrio ishigakensis]|uniref:Uncharacterized protein n=1 Tax=Vibrio ishigakensis TaxID=1481914 RepID=A0A0B8PRX4_9VIBR|nr:hypothetical protein JCM19232_5439 [Vibrio ishigakensis]